MEFDDHQSVFSSADTTRNAVRQLGRADWRGLLDRAQKRLQQKLQK